MLGYLQDDNGDLKIINNDLEIGDIRQDIVIDIANYMPGDNKCAIFVGASLRLSKNGLVDPFFQVF